MSFQANSRAFGPLAAVLFVAAFALPSIGVAQENETAWPAWTVTALGGGAWWGLQGDRPLRPTLAVQLGRRWRTVGAFRVIVDAEAGVVGGGFRTDCLDGLSDCGGLPFPTVSLGLRAARSLGGLGVYAGVGLSLLPPVTVGWSGFGLVGTTLPVGDRDLSLRGEVRVRHDSAGDGRSGWSPELRVGLEWAFEPD